MERTVYRSEDDTIPVDGLQVAIVLDEKSAKIVFDTEYMGLADAWLAQGVARAIIQDNCDALFFYHPDSGFEDEFDIWFMAMTEEDDD